MNRQKLYESKIERVKKNKNRKEEIKEQWPVVKKLNDSKYNVC